MAGITRRTLRVYAALSELRGKQGDVLDALVPFLEPILEVMHGRVFDPQLLATGARKLYRWRINKDIAEEFIPRLVAKGYLQRGGNRQNAFYVVDCKPNADRSNVSEIEDVLRQVIDEFEAFPPRVSDLLNYERTRDELTDILIKFLVSLDAYGEAVFAAEIARLDSEGQKVLNLLPEGGTPLSSDDRYMCARFVREICELRPEFVPHLARLASIGLLTEVVEDFAKPRQPVGKANLTVVLDGPVALDYLGCSGKDLKQDVRTVLDTLREVGCSIVVFPTTCTEIQNNLDSMLSLPTPKRHGYTHEAMRKGEVMEAYVQTVARNPEKALEQAGIQVKPLTLEQYPSQHKYFDSDRYQDFLEAITWGHDIAAREHDTTCLALLLRLREGKHNSDLFRCGFVFVTRNATFANRSRSYCLQAHLLSEIQQGPVIHQRELATLTWLRTGLGAAEDIPRSHLIATCDRVLRLKSEVQSAVAATLAQATPEKLEQFELLIQDYRSIRRLADETLNDERVVTADTANLLLEAMRQATIAEEKERLEKTYSEARAKDKRVLSDARKTIRELDDNLRDVRLRYVEIREREVRLIDLIVTRSNTHVRRLGRLLTAILIGLGVLAAVNFITGWFEKRWWWWAITAAAGLLGLYHFTADVRGTPIVGITYGLNRLSRFLIERRLRAANIDPGGVLPQLEIKAGMAIWSGKVIDQTVDAECGLPEFLRRDERPSGSRRSMSG